MLIDLIRSKIPNIDGALFDYRRKCNVAYFDDFELRGVWLFFSRSSDKLRINFKAEGMPVRSLENVDKIAYANDEVESLYADWAYIGEPVSERLNAAVAANNLVLSRKEEADEVEHSEDTNVMLLDNGDILSPGNDDLFCFDVNLPTENYLYGVQIDVGGNEVLSFDGEIGIAFSVGSPLVVNCYLSSLDKIKKDIDDAFLQLYWYLYNDERDGVFHSLKKGSDYAHNAQSEYTEPKVIRKIRSGSVKPWRL